MPVPRGGTIDPAMTRQRILELSERIFYERGIGAVGIADIAREAGASKASIYKNFGSKEGLVEATLRYRSERVHRWLTEGTAHLAPGRDRILGMFDLLLDWYAQQDFRGCAMISAATEQRLADSRLTDLARQHLQTYREVLTSHLTAADVGEPGSLANRLLILIEGATIVSAIDRDPAVGRDARAIAETLLSKALDQAR